MTATASPLATFNANGSNLTEAFGFHVLAQAKINRSWWNLEEVTAHLNYVQRIMGDASGVLKYCLFKPEDAPDAEVRFNLCGCLVIEDNNLRDDVVEFRRRGQVIGLIAHLGTKMPGWK